MWDGYTGEIWAGVTSTGCLGCGARRRWLSRDRLCVECEEKAERRENDECEECGHKWVDEEAYVCVSCGHYRD